MEFLPFLVNDYNELKSDTLLTFNSDQGRIYIKIGKIDVSIKQLDDLSGIVIDCMDSETCEQDLGTMTILYNDIN